MNDNDMIRRGDVLKLVEGWRLLERDILNLPAAPFDATTVERAAQVAGPYRRTGVFDRDGREICVGDRIRIDLTSNHTKPEYWKPEYEVVFQPPQFALKHVGGDKDSDTARFYFRVPQPRSTESIETIYAAPAPEPAHVTAARMVKIKPLVWSGELSWERKAAQTSIGEYLVQECDCGGTTLKLNHREVWHSENRNEEAAKAAAQAHYEACIRSAIVEGK